MRIGIVGNGSDKFTLRGKDRAFQLIHRLLHPEDTLVSGHSPVGGIDIWAEEAAGIIGASMDIKTPEIAQWNPPGGYGYRARNLDIARTSDEVHVILADVLPHDYEGMRFKLCYHCGTDDHVKSGGCWTGKQAIKAGVPATWHIIANY